MVPVLAQQTQQLRFHNSRINRPDTQKALEENKERQRNKDKGDRSDRGKKKGESKSWRAGELVKWGKKGRKKNPPKINFRHCLATNLPFSSLLDSSSARYLPSSGAQHGGRLVNLDFLEKPINSKLASEAGRAGYYLCYDPNETAQTACCRFGC